MRSLIIGDLHFGVKSNSLSWFESQLNFVRTQIFDAIENNNIDRVIFLGDLHDIRYSVNQQIGIEIRNLFREMLDKFSEKKFILLAGNHDYYSPLEEFSYYNFYELMFSDEFIKCHQNVIIVNQNPYLEDDGSLFLPWYWTENPDHFDEILYNYDFSREIKAIYCHTDLSTWPGARIGALKGCPVYSGHIHNIIADKLANLYNLGSAVSLTFNDVNQIKYLYIIEDHKLVSSIENTSTPRFKRLYNEEIFNVNDEYFNNSFVQLCINSSNIGKAKYKDQIKYLKNTYIESQIRIHIIDSSEDIENLSNVAFNANINTYIKENIPEHLTNKYNIIKEKLKEK